MSEKLLQKLKDHDRKVKLLGCNIELLHWDLMTNAPPRASEERSEQLANLERILHQIDTSSEIGDLLCELGADEEVSEEAETLTSLDRALVRESHRRYSKAKKLPEQLVADLARETGLAHSTWIDARKNRDFSIFASSLEKVLSLIRQKAECIGYDSHIYDALLDDYEPGMKTETVSRIFGDLTADLAPLVLSISEAEPVRSDFLTRTFPVEGQKRFGKVVLKSLGFDSDRGRLDISAHPFTITLGTHDVRLTTRYDEEYFPTSLFGTIHEAGHGMYEQGFGDDIIGTALAEAASLGIHESQSRSWENVVGRSLPFWKRYYPEMRRISPSQLADVELDEFYRGINRVKPSFIRVEADEVTYNLHIILRFELERMLVSGEMKVSELPDAWNKRMSELLGITPSNDAEGVLQDIHWSDGLVGYFSTYTLGNLYGAQFDSALRREIPDIDTQIESGEMSGILNWQRTNIHRHGRIFSAEELCRRATGENLSHKFFIKYLKEKYTEIYAL